MDEQKLFDNMYDKLREAGLDPDVAKEYALDTIENSKPEKQEISGKKSFSIGDSGVYGYVLDVPFGDTGMDTEAMFGGYHLDPSGWENVPSNELKGDINHFTFDSVNGQRNDLDEKWQNFITKASDFYLTEKNGKKQLRGKVHVPETELGKEFINKYKKGELGVSVEYDGLADTKTKNVQDWKITGYSFHMDPSYDTKEPKDL